MTRRKLLFCVLPLFALLSIISPYNDLGSGRYSLRRLADKCIKNVYANEETVFNLPTARVENNHDNNIPSYISLCQEWIRREAFPTSRNQQFIRPENIDVCMDWTAPHYDFMDMISSNIIAGMLPYIKYRHECGLTRTYDEGTIGCDRTTIQQALSNTPLVPDTEVVNVQALKDQCKAVLIDYDPEMEKLKLKPFAYHHPFAWPSLASTDADKAIPEATTTTTNTPSNKEEGAPHPQQEQQEQEEHGKRKHKQHRGRRAVTTTYSNCHSIDFETLPDGTRLTDTNYIHNEWKDSHGFVVTARAKTGGYTPITPNGNHQREGGMARIFDSSEPGTSNNYGDPDLGSPNEKCPDGGGKGAGEGGEPGQPGENCVPRGNVLIIQESKKQLADDNGRGGKIWFSFDAPVRIGVVGILGQEEIGSFVEVTFEGSKNTQRFDIFPLGDNAYQDVVVNQEAVVKLEVSFVGSGSVTGFDFCRVRPEDAPVVTVAPLAPPQDPAMCQLLDFETTDKGARLNGGDYVGNEFYDVFGGLTITAEAANKGYTPGGRARIFDSGNPGTNDRNGSPSLGTPNTRCPGGGVGRGVAGRPGSSGENCKALGNVLIIQESDKPEPDDNQDGGTLIFQFDYPVTVDTVGIVNAREEGSSTLEVFRTDGSSSLFKAEPFGENSVQDILVNTVSVSRLVVFFKGSGAVSGMNICNFVQPGRLPANVGETEAEARQRKQKRQMTIAAQAIKLPACSRLRQVAKNFMDVTDKPPLEEESGVVVYVDPVCTGIPATTYKQHIDRIIPDPSSISVITSPICAGTNLPNGENCNEYAQDLVTQFRADYPMIGNSGFEGSEGIKLEIICSSAAAFSRMIRARGLVCPPNSPTCLWPAAAKEPDTMALLLERPDNKKPSDFFDMMGYGDNVVVEEVPAPLIPLKTSGPPLRPVTTTFGEPIAPEYTMLNTPIVAEVYPAGTTPPVPSTLEDAAILPAATIMNDLVSKLPPGLRGLDPQNPVMIEPSAHPQGQEGIPDPGVIADALERRVPININYAIPPREKQGRRPEDVSTQLGVDSDIGFATRRFSSGVYNTQSKQRTESMKRIMRDNAKRKELAEGASPNEKKVEIFCPITNENGEPGVSASNGDMEEGVQDQESQRKHHEAASSSHSGASPGSLVRSDNGYAIRWLDSSNGEHDPFPASRIHQQQPRVESVTESIANRVGKNIRPLQKYVVGAEEFKFADPMDLEKVCREFHKRKLTPEIVMESNEFLGNDKT